MRLLTALFLAVTTALAAEVPLRLDATWSATQGWSESGPQSAVEMGVGSSFPGVPLVWGGVVAGVDVASTSDGALRYAQAFARGWGGVWIDQPGWGLQPWLGWKQGTARSSLEGGLGATLDLWGPYSLVVGTAYGGDSWSLRVGTRVLWTAPPSRVTPVVLDGVLSPAVFTPDRDGVDDALRLNYRVVSGGPVDRWSWTVATVEGQVFSTQTGRGSLPTTLSWNGQAADGTLVPSLSRFQVTLRAESVAGKGEATATFRTGVIVERSAGLAIVRLVAIPGGAELAELVRELKRAGAKNLTVVAHTNPANRTDAVRALEEDRTVSQPLTNQRASELVAVLVQVGWPPNDLRAEGAGIRRPLVPFDDATFSWKNRRYEITWVPTR